MPRKVIEYLIAVGLLGGCAAPTWHHLSKGQADFNQDRYACIQQSAQAYPAVLQQQAIGVGSAAASAKATGRAVQAQAKWMNRPMPIQ
jgi:hypothetical protein